MGIDARICFRAEGELPPQFMGDLEEDLPNGFDVAPREEDSPQGATHEVLTPYRYYSPNYESGPWPRLCAALLVLHRCPYITAVWYGGDTSETLPRCKPEDVAKLCLQYMGRDG